MSTVARPIGDLDLHLFGEGTHRRLWELLGPQALHVDADGTASAVRFSVWAPHASEVAVVGEWNDWTPEPLAMLESEGPTGIWSGVAPRARSGHRYRYRIVAGDGCVLHRADPMARRTDAPPADASVVPTCADFGWADDDWMSRRERSSRDALRIYEVDVESWREDVRTWAAIAERLGDHVSALGFTHVELLPIAEHLAGPGRRRVSGHYSPTARFGDPDGFRRFVDLLHRRGVGVIVDWVPFTFPRHESGLGRFDGTPLYEVADPRSGEPTEQSVFDHGCRQVRNFLVANALYWFDEFHVDGLRVVGIESMQRPHGPSGGDEHGGDDPQVVDFLREANSVVGEEFPDVLMIAGDPPSRDGVTSPVTDGGLGFSHAWNAAWTRSSLAHLSRRPEERSGARHDLTRPVAFDERFVLPLGHDAVDPEAGGLLERIAAADDDGRRATLRALLAWQWALPGAPLISMGTELAAGVAGDGDRHLPWEVLRDPAHRGVHDLVGHVNAVAAAWPALWRRDADPGGFEWLDADAEHGVHSFIRWDRDGDAAVVCITDVGAQARPGYRVGLPWAGEWEVLVDTDDPVWSGRQPGRAHARGVRRLTAADEPWQGRGSSASLDVAGLSTVWLAARAPR